MIPRLEFRKDRRKPEDWTSTEPWLRHGYATLAGLVLTFVAFAALISISGAVIATGKVAVEGNYRSVQHRDGGIVRAIHVRNGDLVEIGQPIVTLDATEATANLDIVSARVRELSIQQARLVAERDRRGNFSLPTGLSPSDPVVEKTRAAQETLFRARMAAYFGEQDMLAERLKQVSDEIAGLRAQTAARKSERAINETELAELMPLYERGYVNRARISPLKRESARLSGEIGRLEAELARLSSAEAETALKKAQSDKQFQREVADELGKVQAELAEQREALKKHSDIVTRTEVRAPATGRVHALAAHTVGGVITPASQIALIIPQNERLIISAKLHPAEIDRVRDGLTANVVFPAFDARTTPRLHGTVTRIAPAEETDDQGRSFYTVDIDITPGELSRLGASHELIPGMPAEVFIETSYRSILSYLLKPLTDAFTHAFRER